MPRPRNDQLNVPIEQRIEEAFWTLIEDHAPERISVVALSKQAHCNRGTFYYYFTDIYDLLDRIILENQPTTLPFYLLAYLSGQNSIETVKRAMEAEEEKLKKLGTLLMRSESSYCADKLKEACIDVWCSAAGLKREEMEKSDYLMFEFVASGILGMLAYCGKNKEALTADDIIDALLPEVPQALITRVRRRKQTLEEQTC